MNIVRDNLMSRENYLPYCGGDYNVCPDSQPRTHFNGHQFECPSCGWESKFEKEFIDEYKTKWNITTNRTGN